MLQLIRIVLLCLFILSLPTANAVTTSDIPDYVPPKIETPARTPVLRHKMTQEVPEEYKMMIQSYAEKYNKAGQNLASDMEFIIRCESNFDRYALNPNGEFSVGLSQINLKAHTNITREQAENPDFAIEFMAKNLSEGKYSMWYNCSQKLSTASN